jgi:hypothetical protein
VFVRFSCAAHTGPINPMASRSLGNLDALFEQAEFFIDAVSGYGILHSFQSFYNL